MKSASRNILRPRGTAYVLVLSISMLVAVIGAAAISVGRVQLRMSTMSSDAEDARLNARSGLELARAWCNLNPTWRTDGTTPAGAAASAAIGAGSFTVTYSDPVDGNIANSPLDPLLITATGYKGQARQQIQCTITPERRPFASLGNGVTAGGNITVVSGKLLRSAAAPIGSNGNISIGSNAQMDADVYAVGTITGTNYPASRVAGAPAQVLPPATVFDYYIANGTAISYAATGGVLDSRNFSSTNNPYGAANPRGIYVIDCGGNTMVVKKTAVTGTLVLLNTKSDSKIEDSVVLTPGAAGLPVLMIKGPINLEMTVSSTGLVYVSSWVLAKKTTTITGGLIVGGSLTVEDHMIVTWDNRYFLNPPPGFFEPPAMKLVAGSWKQLVN